MSGLVGKYLNLEHTAIANKNFNALNFTSKGRYYFGSSNQILNCFDSIKSNLIEIKRAYEAIEKSFSKLLSCTTTGKKMSKGSNEVADEICAVVKRCQKRLESVEIKRKKLVEFEAKLDQVIKAAKEDAKKSVQSAAKRLKDKEDDISDGMKKAAVGSAKVAAGTATATAGTLLPGTGVAKQGVKTAVSGAKDIAVGTAQARSAYNSAKRIANAVAAASANNSRSKQ